MQTWESSQSGQLVPSHVVMGFNSDSDSKRRNAHVTNTHVQVKVFIINI